MSQIRLTRQLLFAACLALISCGTDIQSDTILQLHYSVSFPDVENHKYLVEMRVSGSANDSMELRMPNWMPGYYQLMNYAENIEAMEAWDQDGALLAMEQIAPNAWIIGGTAGKTIKVRYSVNTKRKFVATSYADSTHAYLIPGASFLYPEGQLNLPATVQITPREGWTVVTGLQKVSKNTYSASNFDILYDSPILTGDLEEFPSFISGNATHRFIALQPGEFDRKAFMENLKKMVDAAIDVIGDVPFDEYTFIGIGPGRGGIEHLNNTTVSFNGNNLDTEQGKLTMFSFLAHEYFHHYNVKRIRPYELGPFDYDRGNRTNSLWLSEGVSVYYEYLILLRAGLIDANTLLEAYGNEIHTLQNDEGRHFQSAAEASYHTWSDGPFGAGRNGPDRTISVYNKGAVLGLLLDLEIRSATRSERSLDDVMRRLYREYYQQKGRGFTDAELRQVCEETAGVRLQAYEYVYSTEEIDWDHFLGMAGMKLNTAPASDGKITYSIGLAIDPTPEQSSVQEGWLGVLEK